MRKRILRTLVGGDAPRKPRKSLPSYNEPTPETRRHLSREEEAELALKRTDFSPHAPAVLVSLFLLTIISVPAMQIFAELKEHRGSRWLPMFDVVKTLPSPAKLRNVGSLWDVWHSLPRAEEIKSAEKALETDSVVSQWLLPPVQSFLTGSLRAGNEQVYLGREGWLFYRLDVDYITGQPFLAPAQLKHRAHAAQIQPDPIRAIVQFRNQLATRGVDLLVLPVPVKASLEGNMLSARIRPNELLQNASFAEFQRQLAAAGVRMFDPAPLLRSRRAGPLYLERDTHWRPETMELVAQELAKLLRSSDTPVARAQSGDRSVATPKEITAMGDVARMLKLPANDQLYAPEKVTIHEVTIGDGLWHPSSEAEVLLLGDSFANIFSLAALGWGESAGFAEHLSLSLGGKPLDCILRNSDGAFATREILAHELSRGRDRLAGKKLVIWEFAARELAFGDWKLLNLRLAKPGTARFFSPRPGELVEVTGTIVATSSVPDPGTVPYRDHIMAVQLADLIVAGEAQPAALQSIVYLWSMRDNVRTAAARLRSGDRVTLQVRPWADVSAQYEQINRSEIDDPALQLEEPVWGELVR